MNEVENVRRADLAKAIGELHRVSSKLADVIVASVFEEIAESIMAGKKVTIPGFGIFKPQHRDARKARNPKTGEMVDVSARNTIKFSPSVTLKKSIAE